MIRVLRISILATTLTTTRVHVRTTHPPIFTPSDWSFALAFTEFAVPMGIRSMKCVTAAAISAKMHGLVVARPPMLRLRNGIIGLTLAISLCPINVVGREEVQR